MGDVLVLTGPPGAGKSTVARLLARERPLSVHLHTDDFYAWIASGYVAPWLPAAQHQNTVVMDAIATVTERWVRGGYDVVVDGIVGPWFLEPWRALGCPISYAVLRPSLSATEARAAARRDHPLQDLSVVGTMHAAFADLGELERHVVDSSSMSPDDTAREVRRLVDAGRLELR